MLTLHTRIDAAAQVHVELAPFEPEPGANAHTEDMVSATVTL
ncbi:hypothetical protein [Massilia consociata]|uniref:Uncharacterized protein n=1 Tax=Massilia consociata TaxID=760117 RepID=A0ABV6FB26_9BURK